MICIFHRNKLKCNIINSSNILFQIILHTKPNIEIPEVLEEYPNLRFMVKPSYSEVYKIHSIGPSGILKQAG